MGAAPTGNNETSIGQRAGAIVAAHEGGYGALIKGLVCKEARRPTRFRASFAVILPA